MENIETLELWKYWFHTKNFEFFFAQIMFFTDEKSYNVKKSNNFFRLSRAIAAVDRNLCHAYSLDHKT
jgi:hypothetical protein